MGITLGFVGLGEFGSDFIPIYKAHPDVDKVVLCDLKKELLTEKSKEFGLYDTENSLEALLKRKDIDAVAIYTQHWMHAPQAIQAMKAGKHVATAVPCAYTLELCQELLETVKQTGMKYVCQETSVFYPEVAYARLKAENGDLGKITYSHGRYYHDWSHGLVEVMQRRGGKNWLDMAGDHPMKYITHSTSGIMSVTKAHATALSCIGYSLEGDEIHNAEYAHGNSQCNQLATMKMSDGSMATIAEFRRVAHPNLGTEMAFDFWGIKGSFTCTSTPYKLMDTETAKIVEVRPFHGPLPAELIPFVFSGHRGSHPYLIHDFVNSIVNDVMPELNIWESLRFTIPGLIAVESTKQGGSWLSVPDYGDAPEKPGDKSGILPRQNGWYGWFREY